jgi:broad specificity phosphatase PhoE
MAAGRIVFVCHAMPTVRPGADPAEWELDDRAREDCVLLAHHLRELRQPVILASPERKARQTADVLGLRLGAWPVDAPGLREVGRPAGGDDGHCALVVDYLAGRLVPGWEHPADVVDRFSAALSGANPADGAVIAVTHGVALALYLGSLGLVDAVPFWRSLPLPCAFATDAAKGTAVRLFPPLGAR